MSNEVLTFNILSVLVALDLSFLAFKYSRLIKKKNIHQAGLERESQCCKITSLECLFFVPFYNFLKIFVTDVVTKKRKRDADVLSAVVSGGLSELEVSMPSPRKGVPSWLALPPPRNSRSEERVEGH